MATTSPTTEQEAACLEKARKCGRGTPKQDHYLARAEDFRHAAEQLTADCKRAVMTDEQRAIRNVRKHLRELVQVAEASIKALDAEMTKPSDVERGKRLAKITNFLDINTQIAKRFGLARPTKKP